MSFPNTTVRARIIKFWKLPEDASVILMEDNYPLLYIGMTGIIRDPAKRIEGRYVEFEPYSPEKTRWGLYCSPEKFMDPVILPEECLEIGPLLASCSCKELESSAPDVKADKSIEIPFERLLVTFFESCQIRHDDLSRVGVSLHQLDMLEQREETKSIAKKMVQGFENMGTLDLFRNGMPSLKDIISRATEVDRLPVEQRNNLNNENVLYITVYHGNNDSSSESYKAHCFWKMSTKGTEYVNSQRQKIESTMPSRHSVNHYEYMKNFLKKHKGKWAIYPIAKMEKPDPSDGLS
ncbi:hypothetical protein CSIM01_09617 [Colletotrichum simmondsii]|uniref:Uncharacterized protein n=1 Tax=Colletotrichum simmondsii TaxID=703756 RepID=A0A135TT18_9PEZI|nr:hypothetical protein CSIM01_09617 [Colletotrichum simmondsii]